MSAPFEVGGTVISTESSFYTDALMMTDMHNRHGMMGHQLVIYNEMPFFVCL